MITTGKPILGFQDQYRWLSSFYPVMIEYNGVRYPSVENAYQAMKFPECERQYFETCSASEAKQKGKAVVLTVLSESEKIKIMSDLIRIKFQQPYFKDLLVSTGDTYIEETNHWGDTFWGVCRGAGQNRLGKILMGIRDELQ